MILLRIKRIWMMSRVAKIGKKQVLDTYGNEVPKVSTTENQITIKF
jgi:hypothetical protein